MSSAAVNCPVVRTAIKNDARTRLDTAASSSLAAPQPSKNRSGREAQNLLLSRHCLLAFVGGPRGTPNTIPAQPPKHPSQ